MLSNRGRALKILIPLALFGLLVVDAAWRIPYSKPGAPQMLADPAAFDGRTVWIPTAKVTETIPGGVQLDYRGTPVKLMTPDRYDVGTYLTARGIFRKSGVVEAEEIHESKNWKAQRGGIYGISAVVLLVFLVSFLKRFKVGLAGFSPKPSAEVVNG